MAEAATIRLRHVTFVTTGKAFVTGGHIVQVTEGVAEVSLDEPLDALTLWHDGYRIDPETGAELRNPSDLASRIYSILQPVVENDKPVEDSDDTDEDEAVDAFVAALTAEVQPEADAEEE